MRIKPANGSPLITAVASVVLPLAGACSPPPEDGSDTPTAGAVLARAPDDNIPINTTPPTSNSSHFCRVTEETVDGAGHSFEMVSIGDSYMWGNGLLTENTYRRQVQRWLAARFNARVHQVSYAHSGATVAPDGTSRPREPMEGDVGSSYPLISEQATCPANKESIGLVLVDGCGNDYNVLKLADPTVDENWVQNRVESKCRQSMTSLLTKIARDYPRAFVVVVGYTPPISQRSFGGTPAERVKLLADLTAWSGLWYAAPFGDQLSRNAQRFYEATNAELRGAARAANAADPHRPYGVDRVLFAEVAAAAENAYAGGDSFLWLVPGSAFGSVMQRGVTLDRDQVIDRRFPLCARRLPDRDEREQCERSSGFHPNPYGASMYAAAIRNVLADALDRESASPGVKLSSPAAVRACGRQEATVYASYLGQPWSGNVMIGGVPVGKTNIGFTYDWRLRPFVHASSIESILPFAEVQVGNTIRTVTIPVVPPASLTATVTPMPLPGIPGYRVRVDARDASGNLVAGRILNARGAEVGRTGEPVVLVAAALSPGELACQAPAEVDDLEPARKPKPRPKRPPCPRRLQEQYWVVTDCFAATAVITEPTGDL